MSALPHVFADLGGNVPAAYLDDNFNALAAQAIGLSITEVPFNADPTGALDSTEGIQAAINTCSGTGGGIVWVPPGTYKIIGTLTVPGPVILMGAGRFASILNFENGSSDCIVMAGTSSVPLTGCGLVNIQLNHANKTGGRTLVLGYANRTNFNNVQVNSSWCGFELWVFNDALFTNVEFQGVLGGATPPSAYYGSYAPTRSYGFFIHAPGDNSGRSDQLTTRNVFVNCLGTALANAADAYVVDGLVGTWNANVTSAEQCNHGLWVKNSAAAAQFVANFFIMDNFNTENCCTSGIRIEGGRTFHFTDSTIYNSSGSSVVGTSDSYAVEILADASASITSDIRFISCGIGSSTKNAIWCAARDVWIDNTPLVAGAGATSNTFPAVQIAAPGEDVMLRNITIRTWGSPLLWKYGIQVDAGTSFISAKGNSLRGAQTRSILWSTTDLNSTCADNDGDAPQKPVPVGLTVSGNLTLTAAQALGASVAFGGTPGAFTATLPTAAALVAGCQNPSTGHTESLLITNSTGGVATIAANTGVSPVGNVLTIASGTQRAFTFEFINCALGSESVAFYG